MSYASLQDLIDLVGEPDLIQLSDRANPPSGAMDEAVIGKALADADAEIDAYLAARYALPLAEVPAIIRVAAGDIARFRLYREPTETVRKRYDDAVKLLVRISKGEAKLNATGAEPPAATSGVVVLEAEGRLFNRHSMRGL